MSFRRLAAALLACTAAFAQAQSAPRQADPLHRALPGGRHHRPGGAHRRRACRREAGPARGDREPAGRRRQYRHGRRRQGGAGRLHDRLRRDLDQRAEPAHLQDDALRSAPRFHRDQPARHFDHRAGGRRPQLPVKTVAELIAYAKAQSRACTYGTAGTGTSMHLAGAMFAQMTGTEPDARAVQGQRARHQRHAGRHLAVDVRQPAGLAAAYPGRQAAGAGGGGQRARRHCPMCRRSPRRDWPAMRSSRGSACTGRRRHGPRSCASSMRRSSRRCGSAR